MAIVLFSPATVTREYVEITPSEDDRVNVKFIKCGEVPVTLTSCDLKEVYGHFINRTSTSMIAIEHESCGDVGQLNEKRFFKYYNKLKTLGS